jgi:dynein heavy chain
MPVSWLSEMFERYVPTCVFEMKRSYSHITPIGTMNFVTTLVNILEGVLKPENLSNKAEQVCAEARVHVSGTCRLSLGTSRQT